jgi:hypothetical protein
MGEGGIDKILNTIQHFREVFKKFRMIFIFFFLECFLCRHFKMVFPAFFYNFKAFKETSTVLFILRGIIVFLNTKYTVI